MLVCGWCVDEDANVREGIDGIDGSDAALGTAPARGASWTSDARCNCAWFLQKCGGLQSTTVG